MAAVEGGDYWSGKINFAGLGNGTDFPKLIDGLMKAEGTHQRRLEKWKKGWVDKSKELVKLNTEVKKLKTVLQTMDSVGELMGKTVSSTDQGVVSASADGNAAFGAHQVEVKQLASSDMWTSSGTGFDKADSVVALSNATFKFSYAGKDISINIPKGTTLKRMVSLINNHPDSSGKLRASTISDGSKFFLKLKGMGMGESNKLVFKDSGIPGLQSASFVNTQTAKDALLKVDGFPPGADKWMHRSSNTVVDALEGVTLNLKSARPGGIVTVNIGHDVDQTKKTVKKFLEALNGVRKQIKKLIEVKRNSDKDVKGSILTGNYGVEMVSQKLKQTASSPGLGFAQTPPLNDVYSSLSSIGITTDANKGSLTAGELRMDEVKFDKALKENPEDIVKLFVVDHAVSSTSSDFSASSLIKGVTKAGSHKVQYEITGGKVTSATIDGHKAAISEWSISGKNDTPAAGLRIDITNQVDGIYTGEVNVKLGKIHELIDEVKDMTNPATGILKIIEKNYTGIIDNIDNKIEREKKRLTSKRRRLKNRFSRLDTTLGRYDRLQGMLRSQIAKLGK